MAQGNEQIDTADHSVEVFRDQRLSLETRIEDLITRLTLEEKVGIMLHESPGVPRLDIPAYNWWNECLHGVARAGRATVFPQAISLGATFDPELLERIASAIGDEGRAKYHAARRNGVSEQYLGLTFWSPNVNIFRDPRWGRGQETYGEDPYLTGRLGVSFVKGLQGDDPRYLKAAACAKHFAVHSGPERLRHEFDARCSEQDLWETYLPAFEALVCEAGVEAVMGAYNRTNGEVCCAHSVLMDEVLRGQWKFNGHYVSDCWALRDFHETHKVTEDVWESCALAVKHGCDLNCGAAYDYIVETVERGQLSETDIDPCVRRLLRTWMRLGFFDTNDSVPYAQTPEFVVGCTKHRELALEAARKSIVLLKNDDDLLPLKVEDSYFLTGTSAASVDALLGNYFGINGELTTILEGITKRLPVWKRLEYRSAIRPETPNTSAKDWISFEAGRYDTVIAVLGLTPWMEGEEGDAIASPDFGDRLDPTLPSHQIEYLRQLKLTGTRVVLVLCGGSAPILGKAVDLADAILWIGYPGEAGGDAVAEVLFGETSPSGKLPITFYDSLEQLPGYEDYSMTNRTYRYLESEPTFPFGFGLSYSRFELEALNLDMGSVQTDEIIVSVDVINVGKCDAEEVVQLYIQPPFADFQVPRYSLRAFKRIGLKCGERCRIELSLCMSDFHLVNPSGKRELLAGSYEVIVGFCSPGIRSETLGAQFLNAILDSADLTA